MMMVPWWLLGERQSATSLKDHLLTGTSSADTGRAGLPSPRSCASSAFPHATASGRAQTATAPTTDGDWGGSALGGPQPLCRLQPPRLIADTVTHPGIRHPEQRPGAHASTPPTVWVK